ncbi:hypothetical protein GOQ29_06445 [Clostridium sp. D2Q-14]|uniref:hypothetical protein n=1 Tax=Anaeromonas gelatinilytica TaxID=2683194 RepID=UPI00193B76AE|nr:hypothetical protein [Anaeromonas gelatinilytica]MBS4535255.1 hypothetical protein [Anaeromonas gelatinilytica]
MNKNKKNYNKLKKYWKLLLKDTSKIDFIKYKYHRCFKDRIREVDIINYLLHLDPELKASYGVHK